MLDYQGFIAETNATNIFIVQKGVVRTSSTRACPEGVTRDAVLTLCVTHDIQHEVTELSLTDLYNADEAFCTGTMGELVPVGAVDGRVIGNGQCGPTTSRLTALFGELVQAEGEAVL